MHNTVMLHHQPYRLGLLHVSIEERNAFSRFAHKVFPFIDKYTNLAAKRLWVDSESDTICFEVGLTTFQSKDTWDIINQVIEYAQTDLRTLDLGEELNLSIIWMTKATLEHQMHKHMLDLGLEGRRYPTDTIAHKKEIVVHTHILDLINSADATLTPEFTDLIKCKYEVINPVTSMSGYASLAVE